MKQKKKPLPGVSLCVSWGNDEVFVRLDVSGDDWKRIGAGEAVVLEGDGYEYEGRNFQDTWAFNTTEEGSLVVSYGGGAEGFVGTIEEAIVSE